MCKGENMLCTQYNDQGSALCSGTIVTIYTGAVEKVNKKGSQLFAM